MRPWNFLLIFLASLSMVFMGVATYFFGRSIVSQEGENKNTRFYNKSRYYYKTINHQMLLRNKYTPDVGLLIGILLKDVEDPRHGQQNFRETQRRLFRMRWWYPWFRLAFCWRPARSKWPGQNKCRVTGEIPTVGSLAFWGARFRRYLTTPSTSPQAKVAVGFTFCVTQAFLRWLSTTSSIARGKIQWLDSSDIRCLLMILSNHSFTVVSKHSCENPDGVLRETLELKLPGRAGVTRPCAGDLPGAS